MRLQRDENLAFVSLAPACVHMRARTREGSRLGPIDLITGLIKVYTGIETIAKVIAKSFLRSLKGSVLSVPFIPIDELTHEWHLPIVACTYGKCADLMDASYLMDAYRSRAEWKGFQSGDLRKPETLATSPSTVEPITY